MERGTALIISDIMSNIIIHNKNTFSKCLGIFPFWSVMAIIPDHLLTIAQKEHLRPLINVWQCHKSQQTPSRGYVESHLGNIS